MAASWMEIGGNVLLFALVFGMSATVDIKCMKGQLRNVKALGTGILCQFVLLPLLGFLVVSAFDLDHGTGITLLVVTSSPGGSYSNWWCSMFNADLALSVAMTAISTVLSTVALPLNLLLYANFAYDNDIISALDWTSLFTSLAIVISAIFAGLYFSWKFHSFKFNMICNKIGNAAGIALIIFSATVTNTGSSDTKIWSRGWSFYIAVALPCVLGLIISIGLSSLIGLPPPERVAVAIECCYQNTGIATSLALGVFEGGELNEAMGVPFFFGIIEALFVGIFCLICWKAGWTKAPSDAPLWRVILTSYEVLEAERLDTNEIEVSLSTDDSESSHEVKSGNALHTYFIMEPTDRTGPKTPSGAVTGGGMFS